MTRSSIPRTERVQILGESRAVRRERNAAAEPGFADVDHFDRRRDLNAGERAAADNPDARRDSNTCE
jgi:hypothetical protein